LPGYHLEQGNEGLPLTGGSNVEWVSMWGSKDRIMRS